MTTATKTKRRAILAFMQNRPGVLNKISMLVRRKMYNVETITVCTTPQPGISRMTLTLYEDSDDKMTQVVRQVEGLEHRAGGGVDLHAEGAAEADAGDVDRDRVVAVA